MNHTQLPSSSDVARAKAAASLELYPRRLASDDPEDAAILEQRSQHVLTLDAAARHEVIQLLIAMGDQWGYGWLHDVTVSLGACRGEKVCSK